MEDRLKYAEKGTEAYKGCIEKNKKVSHSNGGHLHRNDMQIRGGVRKREGTLRLGGGSQSVWMHLQCTVNKHAYMCIGPFKIYR